MTQAHDRPRRRRRAGRPDTGPAGQPGAPAGDQAGPKADPGARPPGDSSSGRRDEPGRGRDPERGWRELSGSSPSQVGLGGALRARDVARPTEADLAEAERTVVVVRRHWQPPQD